MKPTPTIAARRLLLVSLLATPAAAIAAGPGAGAGAGGGAGGGAGEDLTIWPASPSGPDTVYSPPGGPIPTTSTTAAQTAGLPLESSLTLAYGTAYVYRGVDHSATAGATNHDINEGSGSAFWLDGRLSLDTGTPWRPFVQFVANYWDTDPVANLQEIRPTLGIECRFPSATITAGATSYIYPDRTSHNSNELFAKAELNDASIWQSADPILSPYILAAYDLDSPTGWYGEAGIHHDFSVPNTGLTITPTARLAYTYRLREMFLFQTDRSGTGWQHADVGLIATYHLNALLNLPRSTGNWSLGGFIFRTEHLADSTVGDSLTWGGVSLCWQN